MSIFESLLDGFLFGIGFSAGTIGIMFIVSTLLYIIDAGTRSTKEDIMEDE